MGKGLSFLQLKFWHPSNKQNQAKKYEAIQKDADRKRKSKARDLEREQEIELHKTRILIAQQHGEKSEYAMELKREPVAFMYVEPPGLKKSLENERKKIEEEKNKKEWQELLSKMSKDERRLAEREMEAGLTIHERNVQRFEYLKNAPMQGDYVKNIEVQHKPFGKVIRQVQCFKCGQWGHRIGDRECKLDNHLHPLELKRISNEDPLSKLNQNNNDTDNDNNNDKLITNNKKDYNIDTSILNYNPNCIDNNKFSIRNYNKSMDNNHDLLLSDDDNNTKDEENEELRFLRSLDYKQKLKLLEKLQKNKKSKNSKISKKIKNYEKNKNKDKDKDKLNDKDKNRDQDQDKIKRKKKHKNKSKKNHKDENNSDSNSDNDNNHNDKEEEEEEEEKRLRKNISSSHKRSKPKSRSPSRSPSRSRSRSKSKSRRHKNRRRD